MICLPVTAAATLAGSFKPLAVALEPILEGSRGGSTTWPGQDPEILHAQLNTLG